MIGVKHIARDATM